jgi:hypothetical protein
MFTNPVWDQVLLLRRIGGQVLVPDNLERRYAIMQWGKCEVQRNNLLYTQQIACKFKLFAVLMLCLSMS